MAENTLQKLEELLICSVCLDTFKNPKQLSCNHTFCQECLLPIVRRDRRRRLSISCPTCRRDTPVPRRGVAGLESAFHVQNLLEIRESVRNLNQNAAGGSVSGSQRDKPRFCSEHVQEESKLYCYTCEKFVCYQCVITDAVHHDHVYALLEKAFENHRKDIASSLEPLEKQVAAVEDTLRQLDANCKEITDHRVAIEESVHVAFRRLHDVLEARETELIGQLNSLTESKLKRLTGQREKIETTLAQLNSFLHFMRESLRTQNKRYLLSMKSSIIDQVSELTTPLDLEVTVQRDIAFSAPSRLTMMCRNYAQVFIPGLPDPAQCYLAGKGSKEGVVGETAVLQLHAICFEGRPCVEPIQSLECEIVSEMTGAREFCDTERTGLSEYGISYQPTREGSYKLHVTAEGQHILGSPFSITVSPRVKMPSPAQAPKPSSQVAANFPAAPVNRVPPNRRPAGGHIPLATLEPRPTPASLAERPGVASAPRIARPIITTKGMLTPMGVATNEGGEFIVTEERRHCVAILSTVKNPRSFGGRGSQPGKFFCPCGVAVDREGNVFVVDGGNHRIQQFSPRGHFRKTVGTKGTGALQFRDPASLAFNAANNRLYVSDKNNCRIQILNLDLTLSGMFGRSGCRDGQLNNPWGVACDGTGKVYVADTGNNRIQVFTADGEFLSSFGGHGRGRGELDFPMGVAVDTGGKVYVSEHGNHRVSVFTHDGRYLASYGRNGKQLGEFQCPRGLAVTESGMVCVCDSENGRICLFAFGI